MLGIKRIFSQCSLQFLYFVHLWFIRYKLAKTLSSDDIYSKHTHVHQTAQLCLHCLRSHKNISTDYNSHSNEPCIDNWTPHLSSSEESL